LWLPYGPVNNKGEVNYLDKNILQDYIDACELIKETEKDIKKLNRKKRTIIQTNVKGSMKNFPYAEQHFRIQGTTFTVGDDSHLRYSEKLLAERKANAEKVKIQVDEFMNTIPLRMQRIIRYKYFEGLPWEEVADKLGRKATGDSVRMELTNFLKK